MFESVIKMVTIRGSYVGNRKDSAEALEFFRRGLIKAPFKTIGLSELQKVVSNESAGIPRQRSLANAFSFKKYNLMHEGKIAGRYVVDTSK